MSTSRRAGGRSSGSVSGSRTTTSQRGLAQNRRPARVATPEDDGEEFRSGEEEEEEEAEGSVDGDSVSKSKKNGLPKEVWGIFFWIELTR